MYNYIAYGLAFVALLSIAYGGQNKPEDEIEHCPYEEVQAYDEVFCITKNLK